MTREEFNKLPSDEQERFINEGGVISSAQVNGVSAITTGVSLSDQESDLANTKDTNIPELVISSVEKSVTLLSTGNKEQGGSSDPKCAQSENNEDSNESSLPAPPSSLVTDSFDIKDPVELLYLLDDTISTGLVKLHKWQIQFLLDFAKGGESDSHPFQSVVRACNGSGKDKYLIAPASVWLCMRYRKARCIVTSSSGVQLDNQTCAYIEQLCLSANRKFGPIWKCNYRYYECLATESPMVCYATDEPGKAEGFHPLEFNAKMAILVSEDKTVPDEINMAINKCTGYTHRCHVSTPGNAFGHFYDLCSTAVDRSAIKNVNETKAEDYIQYHIQAKDCPHLSSSYIKQMVRDLPGGENGSAYKSQVLAEFGSSDEMVVIPYTYIWQAKNKPIEKWVQEEHNKGGLDLSDGGDETVLVVRNGNRILSLIPFKFDNTEDTVKFLNEKFREHGLVSPESLIFADCGGIGKPILDRLKRQGWANIRYCDNRRKSIRPKTYRNWGAESWFHFGELLKHGELMLIDDPKLVKQLSTRYYKIIDGAIHQLLSKIEMRSRGYPSPDRADAVVLAFSDYKSTFVEEQDKNIDKPFEIKEETKAVKSEFTLKAMAFGTGSRQINLGRYNVNNGQKKFEDLNDEILEFNRKLTLAK